MALIFARSSASILTDKDLRYTNKYIKHVFGKHINHGRKKVKWHSILRYYGLTNYAHTEIGHDAVN